MSSPYRKDTDALRERLAHLEGEIARLRDFGTELEKIRATQAALEKEADDVRRRLAGSTRRLPMLDDVKVASPCSASWDAMLGDDRVRFCLSCEKNVYNISAMPREEAEAFIAARTQGEVCIRFYQRADGTLITSDCPVGVTRKRRKKVALAIAGAGAMAAAAMAGLRSSGTACKSMHPAIGETRAVMGEMAIVEVPDEPPPPPTQIEDEPPAKLPGKPVMGRIAPAR